jgi:hypothetical protein
MESNGICINEDLFLVEFLKGANKYSLIAKQLPVTNSLLEVVGESDIFTREVKFFQDALPKLLERVSPLPVVKCLSIKSDRLIMEDLSAKDYKIMITCMDDIGKKPLSFHHYKIAMEKLARFHASSFGLDWLKILPHLSTDAMLQKESNPFPVIFKKACQAYARAISYFYPEIDRKYSEWLESCNPSETMLKLVKPDKKYINVLGHGDFWLNNIMFRTNPETNHPEDAVFIDFQLCRFVPGSRDIQNLLFTCTSKSYREKYESQLIAAYVRSFNDALGYEKHKLQEFQAEYDEGRMFGVLISLVFRSMNHMSDLYPRQGQEMSDEMFQTLMSGQHFDNLIQRCEQEEFFRDSALEMIEDLIQVLDKYILQQRV